MNPLICYPLLPPSKEVILFHEAREDAPLEGVGLHVGHAPFRLPLVSRRSRSRRQHHRPVVAAEGGEFRINLRIEPIRLQHRRLQVVDHDRSRHPAEVFEGVLKALQKAVGRLMENRLAVAFARVRQHHPQHVRPPAFPIRADHRCAGAEVDLCLVPRSALHPSEGDRQRRPLLPQQASHAVVAHAPGLWKLGLQVLVNPLRRQPSGVLLQKPRQPWGRDARLGHREIPGRRAKTGHLIRAGRGNRRRGRF